MDRWQLWRRVWFRMNRKSHSRRQYRLATRTRSDPEGRSSHPPPPPARYLMGPQHFVFVSNVASGITQRPKVLLDVDCSDLLTGGSGGYENFSSTCWLEDHLHRFGNPSPSHHATVEEEEDDLPLPLPFPFPTTDTNMNTHAPLSRAPPLPGSYEFHGMTELERPDSIYEEFSGGGGGDGDDDDSSGEEASFSSSEEDVPPTTVPRWSPRPTPNLTNPNLSPTPSPTTRNDVNIINLHRFPYVDPLHDHHHQAQVVIVPQPPPYHAPEEDPPPSYEEAIAGDGGSAFQDHDGMEFLW